MSAPPEALGGLDDFWPSLLWSQRVTQDVPERTPRGCLGHGPKGKGGSYAREAASHRVVPRGGSPR